MAYFMPIKRWALGFGSSTGGMMIELEHAMIYRLEVAGPVEAMDGSGNNPRRQYWQMSSATLKGPKIDASSALPGIDWFTPIRMVTVVPMCGFRF
jgi:hypothetical protein